jgi:NAD(P)-dependent dehydrogenase (short-subunit alcohol dehydrogenase family)
MSSMTGIVVVTGAAGALGRKTSEVLGQLGCKVAGIDLAAVPADTVALAIGGVDLTDAAAVQAAMARIGAAFGRLDGLVNIAGGFRWETTADGSVEALLPVVGQV